MAAAAATGDQIAAVLGRHAILRRVAVEVGADGSGNHALAFLVALHRAAELDDDADRLMANRQAFFHRILALEDVDVGTANGGGGDLDQRVIGADIGNRLVGDLDTTGFNENLLLSSWLPWTCLLDQGWENVHVQGSLPAYPG